MTMVMQSIEKAQWKECCQGFPVQLCRLYTAHLDAVTHISGSPIATWKDGELRT